MQSIWPNFVVESFSKTHVEHLQEKRGSHHHLLPSHILPNTIRWTIRERDEGTGVVHLEISRVEPPLGQELLGSRGKV